MSINRDELAARLLQTFSAELEDQVVQLDGYLAALEARPDGINELKAVFRVLHTLKGAARAANVKTVEDVCHDLESVLAAIRDTGDPIDTAVLHRLQKGADMLAAESLRLSQGKPDYSMADSDSATSSAPGSASSSAPSVSTNTGIPSSHVSGSSHVSVSSHAAADRREVQREPDIEGRESDVRVRADQLYSLLRSSSELYVNVGSVRDLSQDLESVRSRMAALLQRRETRFDGDSLATLSAISTEEEAEFNHLVRDMNLLTIRSGQVVRSLTTVTGEIASRVRALRMRPFSDISSIFNRVVRDAAQETGKSVKLIIEGNEIEADRTVLDEMREAIMHIARNSVAHGIEDPAVRKSQGKDETGIVRISARVTVDHIIVEISDDGAGVNVEAVKHAVQQRGLPAPTTHHEFVQRLFDGGISTQAKADSIAGRGVGLDAVRVAMDKIRGSYTVSWKEGEGTTFTLDAPVSLATIRAVLVKVGIHLIAIPDVYIDLIERVDPSRVHLVDGRYVMEAVSGVVGDGLADKNEPQPPITILSMARLLGPPFKEKPADKNLNVVIVKAQGQKIALIVDELVGEDEIVIRAITSRGDYKISQVSGAALLPNGRIALIANIGGILGGIDSNALSSSGGALIARDNGAASKKRIIVADDSITTRTLEQSVLESAGYEVLTAVDGSEAWQMLQEKGADLVVSDVEMPRMDGFSLCMAIRASPKFKDLPLILVTALENISDQERGAEVGANAYLTKSSFDQAFLLDTIRQLLH